MALQNHNPNVLPSRHDDEESCKRTKSKLNGTNSQGMKLGGNIQKENASDAIQYTTISHDAKAILNHSAMYDGVIGGSNGSNNIWHRNVILSSLPSREIFVRTGEAHLSLHQETPTNGKPLMIDRTHSMHIHKRRSFGSSQIQKNPPFDRTLLQQNATQHGPFHLESLTQAHSGNSISKPPSKLAKYVDVARSSTTTSSITTASTSAFTIYEDRVHDHEKVAIQPLAFSPEPKQSYTQKLHAIASGSDRWAAHEAEVLLREMIAKYKYKVHDVQPDGGCYNCVIHAYAEAGLPHQAENVMRLMFSDYKNGNMSAEPNVRCLTNVLHAWRKSKDPEAPDRCEALLSEMYGISDANPGLSNCMPDTFAVTVLLHCWVESQRPDACDQAEATFRQMKKRFQEGDESMRPDCISYSILLNTYAQKMMIEDAERILWEMVDDYTLDGNKAAEPRTRNFNTVIAMHARSSIFDAPERAEKVLRRYRDLCSQNLLNNKPDEYSYSLVLKSWCNSKRDDGITQAVSRMNWMRELNEEASFPDVVKYTTIISAFARKHDLTGAESLLHRMTREYLESKDSRVMPDVSLFDNVIKAFTTLDIVSTSSAYRAESLMRNMWYLYTDCGVSVRPKHSTYKHVIIGFKKAGMALRADELLWEMENKSVAKPSKELIQTVMNAWHDSTHPEKQKRINSLRLFMNDRFSKIETFSHNRTSGNTRRNY